MRKLLFLFFMIASSAVAQQSPHGPIKIACEVCHSTDTWTLRTDASFNHNSTGFPLVGSHQGVECRSCHENLVFTGKSTDCASCHADIHQKDLGPNCVRCHNTQSWIIADMKAKHQETRFPLLGKHKLIDCDECHSRASSHRFAGTPISCITCHKKEYDATTAPNHAASGFGVECATCHRIDALGWPGGFDHNLTSFPLTGVHKTIVCADCHKNNAFGSVPANCYDCHAADFRRPTSPNHVTGGFSQQCQSCHSTSAWQPASFDHSKTNFPLTGEHARVDCQSCHKNGNYQLVYTNCNQCHRSQFEAVTSPNHVSGNFSANCLTCHTTAVWSPATFDHASTKLPLTGKHVTTDCQSCHTNGNYQLTFNDCNQCHKANFDQAANPNHVTGNFSRNCVTCHTTAAWQPASFDHNQTRLPLTGAHTTIQCASCHVNGNFQLAFTDCYQCHQPNFAQTVNPNHVTGNFSHNCITCHTTTAWQPASFDHNQTRLPLTGAHTTIQCASCHVNGNFQLAFTDCYQCHQPNFEQAANPNHVTGNFSHNCVTCHTTTAWQPASFDHNQTRLPLTGAHTTIQCASCHVNGNYQLAFTDCYQCHQPNFEQALNPNHVTGNFSHNCVTCHSTAAWQPATFDHNQTRLPLTGAHTTIQCASCHVNGNYQLAFTDCYQCHQPNFEQALNPNHVTGNFSHNCVTCHTTAAWQPASFDHNQTRLPLTGAHTTIQCASCHVNGNYQLAFTDCYQCHQPNFEQALNPNHVTGNFSHNCVTCHSTAAWQPATFDHNQTRLPLTGAHTTIQCASCHVNGNYQLAFTDCYQCHQPNFEQALNPNHVTGNFSHNCVTCHSTAAWQPATFDHNQTLLPLTGAHTAIQCNSCHVNGNYQLAYTNCYQCHQPNFEQAANPNHVTGNFSHDCLTCHTTAAWQPATFNHATTNFPLTGKHTTTLCQSCHTNGNYQLTYANCYQCHQTEYAQPTDPNHVAANFDKNCATCHTTTAWTPSTLNHDGLYFRINSGRHRGQWTTCATCHNVPTSYAQFTCFNCHTHDKAVTDGHHNGVSGYSYSSPACYNCHRGV